MKNSLHNNYDDISIKLKQQTIKGKYTTLMYSKNYGLSASHNDTCNGKL